jgi:hypothetical protein
MRNDELDRILDGALAHYSGAEPLAGLEQRILNRVRAENAAPRAGRVRFARWAVAVGVAVAAVWLVGQASRPVPRQIRARAAVAGFTEKKGQDSGQARRPVLLVRKKSGQARRPVLLSREERALLELAAQAPDQAREAMRDLQRQSTEPIQIAEIRIEPLRSDDAK